MNPTTKKISNKLFVKDKIELSTEKVELSLKDAEKIINSVKSATVFRNRMENKIDLAKKQLIKAIGEIKPAMKDNERDRSSLVKAGGEIEKLKKDMADNGFPTQPLDARRDEIADAYNKLSKIYNDLNRIVITVTNI